MIEHHIHIHFMSEDKDDDRSNDFLRGEVERLSEKLIQQERLLDQAYQAANEAQKNTFSVARVQRAIERELKERDIEYWQTVAEHIIKRL